MARELAAVYTQVFGFSMDLSLLTYSDPRAISSTKLCVNKTKLDTLYQTLYPLLTSQNKTETSCLSLELQHLLENCKHTLDQLSACLARGLSPKDHFTTLHLSQPCSLHQSLQLKFEGGDVPVSLCLINDVEILYKRLNSVFYCLPAQSTLQFLDEVISFVGRLRGVSPIPQPDLFLSSVACVHCLQECSVLPNQGENFSSMLAGTDCPHVCRPVRSEPVKGQFENELKQLGLGHVCAPTPAPTEVAHPESHIREASLETLNQYTIFQDISKSILELSHLVYWNSGQNKLAEADAMASEMAQEVQHNITMHQARPMLAQHLGTETPTHFFDEFQPQPLESLFCGGVFSSLEDTIIALKKDCASTFLKKANYQNILKKQNELFVRLNSLFQAAQDPSVPQNSNQATCSLKQPASTEQIWADANTRKDAYIKKVTKDGLKRLYECLESQGNILSNTLCLRVWGSVIYEESAQLKNHFLFTQQFLKLPWELCLEGTRQLFENSKYVKNSLYSHQLSKEHIDSLTLQFYHLLIGPLFRKSSFFPIPDNVTLAYCLDAAGVMPHQKVQITDMIWSGIEAKEWIDATFNNYYNIQAPDLNKSQQEAWRYIRELVLSVALYNRAWEKNLQIFSTCDIHHTCLLSCPSSFVSGIYLTYQLDQPLVFIFGEKGWVFKDLYALLYSHLQLTGVN